MEVGVGIANQNINYLYMSKHLDGLKRIFGCHTQEMFYLENFRIGIIISHFLLLVLKINLKVSIWWIPIEPLGNRQNQPVKGPVHSPHTSSQTAWTRFGSGRRGWCHYRLPGPPGHEGQRVKKSPSTSPPLAASLMS